MSPNPPIICSGARWSTPRLHAPACQLAPGVRYVKGSRKSGATQLLPLHAILTQLGRLWLCPACSGSSKAAPEAVRLSFIMFGVFESRIWQVGKQPSNFSVLPKLGAFTWELHRLGSPWSWLNVRKDMKISQQQHEVLRLLRCPRHC